MSTVVGKLVTAWVSDTSGLSTGVGRASGVFKQLGNTVQGTTRQTGLLNQQFRAIGTTLRYAFAGGAVYGLFNLVRGASQFQSQLALITITADQGQTGLGTLRSRVDELASSMVRLGVETLSSSQDVVAAVTNIVSSISGMQSPQAITGIARPILEAAQLAQTPAESLAGVATTLPRIFGQNVKDPKVAQRLMAEWVKLIQTVPGGPQIAPQLIQQLAPQTLPGVSARMTPEQVLGLTGAGVVSGLTPGQIGRSNAYLIRLIGGMQHMTKDTQAAFRGIGLSPDKLGQNKGFDNLVKMFEAVRAAGGVKGGDRAEAIMRMEGMAGIENEGLGGLGISGKGRELIQQLVPQTFAQRAFLSAYLSWVKGANDPTQLTNLINQITDASKNDGEYLRKEWEQYQADQPLKSMAQAIGGIRQTIMTDIMNVPGLKTAAKKVFSTFTFTADHNTIRHIGEGLLAAIGIGVGASRLGIGRGIFSKVGGAIMKILRRGGAGGAAEAAAGAEGGLGALLAGGRMPRTVVNFLAAQALLSSRGPGTSPIDPLYVVIVGSLMGRPTGVAGAVGDLTGGTGIPPIVAAGGNSRLLRLFGRALPLAFAAGLAIELRNMFHGKNVTGHGDWWAFLHDVDPRTGKRGIGGTIVHKLIGSDEEGKRRERENRQNARRLGMTVDEARQVRFLAADREQQPKSGTDPGGRHPLISAMARQAMQGNLSPQGVAFLQQVLRVTSGPMGMMKMGKFEQWLATHKGLPSPEELKNLVKDVRGSTVLQSLGLVAATDRKQRVNFKTLPFRPGSDHPLISFLEQQAASGNLSPQGTQFLHRTLRGSPTAIRRAEANLESHNQRLLKELTKDKRVQLDGDISITVDLTDETKKKDQAKLHFDPSQVWQGGPHPQTRGQKKAIKKNVGRKKVTITVGPKDPR
jgi:hypothetical protein